MNDLEKLKIELMKDPAFEEEYEKIQPELALMRLLIDLRCEREV